VKFGDGFENGGIEENGDGVENANDNVMEYAEEICNECLKPRPDHLTQDLDNFGWVCCDRCDKWYHSLCVGCDDAQSLKET
jgi:hypothetical protein